MFLSVPLTPALGKSFFSARFTCAKFLQKEQINSRDEPGRVEAYVVQTVSSKCIFALVPPASRVLLG